MSFRLVDSFLCAAQGIDGDAQRFLLDGLHGWQSAGVSGEVGKDGRGSRGLRRRNLRACLWALPARQRIQHAWLLWIRLREHGKGVARRCVGRRQGGGLLPWLPPPRLLLPSPLLLSPLLRPPRLRLRRLLPPWLLLLGLLLAAGRRRGGTVSPAPCGIKIWAALPPLGSTL